MTDDSDDRDARRRAKAAARAARRRAKVKADLEAKAKAALAALAVVVPPVETCRNCGQQVDVSDPESFEVGRHRFAMCTEGGSGDALDAAASRWGL